MVPVIANETKPEKHSSESSKIKGLTNNLSTRIFKLNYGFHHSKLAQGLIRTQEIRIRKINLIRHAQSQITMYSKGGSHYLEDGPFYKSSPLSNPPLNLQRKSKNVANDFMVENGVPANHLATQDTRDNGSDRWFEKLVRRNQKSETHFTRVLQKCC
ncbi:hypothetical protein H5410_061260 [Solanum commersonii]|uniref:Uncharacterized protein n=1 Tax=Solanum commersonii TaxID=4109 RepID=A0A9J5W935_SOLCO|nr:hypothetical protein H5410_061260 [Solanum commersonii]